MKPFLFITIPYSQLPYKSALECSPEIGVNIVLDTVAIDIAAIQNFVSRSNINYRISLSEVLLHETPVDVLFNKIYTLFALSDSFGEETTNIVLFTGSHEDDYGNLEELKKLFEQQGEHPINFITAVPGTNYVRNNILFCSYAHIVSLREHHLEDYIYKHIKKVILWCDNETQPPDTQTIAFDTLLKHNRYAAMLFSVVARNSIAELHHHQSQLWQRRAMLYLSFIALGKRISQDEYYGIKEWYDDQYEVLPLWYKRFGHIIKVFMGKRKFSSLFNDKKG